MMLTEIAWRDYLLLEKQRQDGNYRALKWIRFVAPDTPLPVGLMTTYQRKNHIRLFRRGENDAAEQLAGLLSE